MLISRQHLMIAALTLVAAAAAASTASAQRPSIAELQAQVATLQAHVSDGTVPNIASYVTMDISTPSRPTLRLSGANLQVVDGLGSTATAQPNGLGNLIVGYDEPRPLGSTPDVCSLGQFTNEATCTNGGGIWSLTHKSGSHNIVVGRYHNYSRYGGLVAGEANTVNGPGASVTAGYHDRASGDFAGVSAGEANVAAGYGAGVSGGTDNVAQGDYSSVSGGQQNTASGNPSSVSGGFQNQASGAWASVSGGDARSAPDTFDWVAGALFQDL